MSTGLIALLDDVVSLTKVAAASLDDIGTQTLKAGAKSAGVVIDDTAVTPKYVVGFAASRELPIVARIARGSIKNKLLFLLPAALMLSAVAPGLMTPLLMLGGAYLCYEGAEKILEVSAPGQAHKHEEKIGIEAENAEALEKQRVEGAIRTDFILSAEIMAITLSAVPDAGFWTRAIVLALVGIGITAVVYGLVAIIVKADDFGVFLSRSQLPSIFGAIARGLGKGLVKGMPIFLIALSAVGTVAMLWVGGSIFVHGLAEIGWPAPEHRVQQLGDLINAGSAFAGAAKWLLTAFGFGALGLLLGALLIPMVQYIVAPLWSTLWSTVRRS